MLKSLLLAPAIILFACAGLHYFLTWKKHMTTLTVKVPETVDAEKVTGLTATLENGQSISVPAGVSVAIGDSYVTPLTGITGPIFLAAATLEADTVATAS